MSARRPRIELIYDDDCPNVGLARDRLREACRRARVEPAWVEWSRSDAEAPGYVQAHGSPTILVDGADPFVEPEIAAGRCRVYRTEGGLDRAPPVADLENALRAGSG
ncbi:MAG: thioredoxin family protein [Gemmatimonadota bacterium]|nr:thioredoxin family protein [Gemmatimonadota bacterium]